MKKKKSPLRLIAICLLICVALTALEVYVSHLFQHQKMEEAVSLHVAQVREDVAYAVEQVYSVQALVMGSMDVEIDLENVAHIFGRDGVSQNLRCITLAPGGVIDQVYPQKNNESLLGVDLLGGVYPHADVALKAKRTGELAITPPFNLPNGQRVIAARLPVHRHLAEGAKEDWGIVSVCIAFPGILGQLREDVLADRGYAYRILQVGTAAGQEDLVLFSRNFREEDHVIARDFTIGDISLRLEATPRGGWLNYGKAAIVFSVIALLMWLTGVAVELVINRLRKLRTEATEDVLTGVLNRAAGQKRIDQLLGAPYFREGALLLIDIDNFKNVNDRLGHEYGDEAIIACAQLFRRLFRADDVICRLGGDEFAIFLSYPGDRSFLNSKIQSLLRAMRQDIQKDGKSVHISASVGVAIAPDHGRTFREMYHRADVALYRSKALGRDCATVYDAVSNTGAVDETVESEKGHDTIARDRNTILIVDDDFINREIVKNIFSGKYRFVEAEDGLTGLAMVEELENELCAILLDVIMPGLSGLQVLEKLYAKGISSRIPVFLITAHNEDEIAQEAYGLGVVDVINKPVTPFIILRRVQSIIELFQARQILRATLLEDTSGK